MHDTDSIPAHVHIVGAGGAGMSGLAKILSQMGRTVTGSDLKPGRMLDALADVGVRTWVGHRPDEMSDVGVVVRSSAVPDLDPEIDAARAAGIPVWERPALLAALTEANPAMGIAGTHGKTTSTAMAVTALRGMGLDPSFLVGGHMVGLNTGAHVGRDGFVLEADEAFGTFRHLELSSVLVTNIEADHLDHYGTVAALEDAFAQVVDRVGGTRIACIDDPGVRRLARRSDVTTYGIGDDAAWRISGVDSRPGGVAFSLTGPRGPSQTFHIPQPGIHTALNAAGVAVLLASEGHDMSDIAGALASYAGVRRRYEIRAVVSGVTIVDDYAHHPTEVGATVAAALSSTPGRVFVVFQPHRFTRTADLGPDFGEPLSRADHVIVTDVYAAGEQPIIGVSGRLVSRAVEAAGGSVEDIPILADVPDRIAALAESGDTVLLLGAGDITVLARAVTRAVEAGP